MTETEQRVENRVPIALRIKLRFRKLDTFVSKFATNISSNGMFISSRKPKEMGTLLRFELRLADDSTVIAGQGKVAWVRAYDPQHPKRPHGMGIEFTTLSQKSRELICHIVAARVEQGLGEDDEIPFAAKRQAASEAGAARPAPAPGGNGNSAAHVGALGLPEIDSSDVDIGAAVARARALVGSTELDEELEGLYRVSAAPVAETVDEASNNLARMLGGTAVQARRIRYSDPPTGVEITAAPPAESEVAPPPDGPLLEAEAPLEVEAPLEAEAPPEAPLEVEDAPSGSIAKVIHYSRAQTDASPDIIDEFDDAEANPTLVADGTEALRQMVEAGTGQASADEESLESLPVLESESHAPAGTSVEAPMHLDDGNDESLDVDIDEATPNPESEQSIDSQAPNAQAIDLGAVEVPAVTDPGDNDFSESTETTMDLTDLIEIPLDMADGDEIDIDID